MFQRILFIVMMTLLVACDGNAQRAGDDKATTLPAEWINSNLKIVANSSDSVTLTWAPKSNAASYRVYRSINTTFDTYYNNIRDILDPTITSFTDVRLAPGTPYYYLVASINKDDSTSVIGRASVTTPTTDK